MARAASGLLVWSFLMCACVSGDDEETEPPGCDPYSCDCGLASKSATGGSDQPSTCVGSPLCNADADCPPAPDDSVEPICETGDVVHNGFSGECILPCTDACPGEMECIGGRCVYLD